MTTFTYRTTDWKQAAKDAVDLIFDTPEDLQQIVAGSRDTYKLSTCHGVTRVELAALKERVFAPHGRPKDPFLKELFSLTDQRYLQQ